MKKKIFSYLVMSEFDGSQADRVPPFFRDISNPIWAHIMKCSVQEWGATSATASAAVAWKVHQQCCS